MSQPIRGQGGHLVFPISPKNTNLVEDVEILLPVKFCWILFSCFREEVENVSANQRPERPSCFSDRPEKHKLGRGCWVLASCQVSLNSVQWFQRRSRKCEKLMTDRRTDDGQHVITIVHLSLRLRCTKNTDSQRWPSFLTLWSKGFLSYHLGARTGTLKNPTKCLWRWEPVRRSNFFFSPPAHLCAVTYMTEISWLWR